MGTTKSFKDEFTFEQRVEESRDIQAKYPDRVPVIVERYAKSDLPQMEKNEISCSTGHVCGAISLHFEQQTSSGPWKSSHHLCTEYFTPNS